MGGRDKWEEGEDTGYGHIRGPYLYKVAALEALSCKNGQVAIFHKPKRPNYMIFPTLPAKFCTRQASIQEGGGGPGLPLLKKRRTNGKNERTKNKKGDVGCSIHPSGTWEAPFPAIQESFLAKFRRSARIDGRAPLT